MKYMVLIASEPDGWDHLDAAGQEALYQRISAWWESTRRPARSWTAPAAARGYRDDCPHARDGDTTVTDGPFVEGKEIVGGYAIIDVPDLDAAIALVSRWPAPDTLEIRPVVENRH